MARESKNTFFAKLKRRNVLRVAAVYLATAWLIIQFGTVLGETLDAPHWVMRFSILLLALGFPSALAFAWAFEVTPECLKSNVSRLISAALIVLCLCSSAAAAELDQSQRLDNLETLASVWGRIYLFHPRVVSEGLEWEKALADAIPAVEAAKNDQELIDALQRTLLTQIHDPEVRIFRRNALSAESHVDAIAARLIAPGIGLIAVRDPDLTADQKFLEKFADAYRGLGELQKLVVDLRWPGALSSPDSDESVMLRFFVAHPMTIGSSVQRQHTGWSERQDAEVYHQNWIVRGDTRILPITQRVPFDRNFADTKLESLPIIRTPTLFIINDHSESTLFRLLDTLQRESGAAIAWEKRGAAPRLPWINTIPIGGDYEIYIPDAMLLNASGGLGFRADLERAGEILDDELGRMAADLLPAPPHEEAAFAFGMKFPEPAPVSDSITREQRIAGLIKLWMIVNQFDPHLEFAGPQWKSLLREGIPAVEAAPTARDYYQEIRRLTAPLNDNHVTVSHRSLGAQAVPALELVPIQGRVFVSRIGEGVTGNVKAGDEIVAVDGKAVREIEESERARISVSTPATFPRNLWTRGLAMRGEKDTKVRLALERGGTRHQVGLFRVDGAKFPQRPAFRRLDASLGYINLFELANVAELDRALRELADTRGLVLDLRGYPNFWITFELTARLVDQPVRSTKFVIPIVDSADPLSRSWNSVQYLVEPHDTIRYRKPVAVLINENTQSMAEDFCIYLRNGKRATFVGSQTAGTNGNIATIALPGGGQMRFTGARALYDDDSRFQNIGIVPDVEVRPTVDDVRAGRDEVLRKAIEVLSGAPKKP